MFGGGLTLGGMTNRGVRAPGGITIPFWGLLNYSAGWHFRLLLFLYLMGILTILGVVFCAMGSALCMVGASTCVPLSETLSAPYRCPKLCCGNFLATLPSC